MFRCDFCQHYIDDGQTLEQHILNTHFDTLAVWYTVNNYDVASVLDLYAYEQTIYERYENTVHVKPLTISIDEVVTHVEGMEKGADEGECPICLNFLKTGDPVKINKCGHLFCLSCLTTWIISHDTCPICRQNLSNNQGQSANNTFPVASSVSE